MISADIVADIHSDILYQRIQDTGENRHATKVSWELGFKVPIPKTEKSADLVHYFSGVATSCVLKNQHRT